MSKVRYRLVIEYNHPAMAETGKIERICAEKWVVKLRAFLALLWHQNAIIHVDFDDFRDMGV